jgi:hypothetical protein
MRKSYLDINAEALKTIAETEGKDSPKYRSVVRFLECQDIYWNRLKKVNDRGAAQQAAAEHWNKWANEMLARCKELEEAGEWELEKDILGNLRPKNLKTENCINEAITNFSGLHLISLGAKNSKKDFVNIYCRNIYFSNFVFPGSAFFDGTTFSGKSFLFRKSEFKDDAWFREASFAGNAEFHKACFAGIAEFRKASFADGAAFHKAHFARLAWFVYAQFEAFSGFIGAHFTGEARFNGAHFNGGVTFSSAHFIGEASYDEAYFAGTAGFSSAYFAGSAGFSGAQLLGRAEFGKAYFRENAEFYRVHFADNADFNRTQFAGDVEFCEAQFKKNAIFSLATFEQPVDFQRARFEGHADFRAIDSRKSFSLHGTRFHVVPDFNEAAFHAPPVLDEVEIDEPLTARKGIFRCVEKPEENARKISRNFRALGKMAHEARDWLNEMEFFAQEIRTRRFGLDFPLGKWRWLRAFLACMVHPANAPRWKKKLLGKIPDGVRRRFRKWSVRLKASPYLGSNPGRFWFGLFYEKFSNFGRSFARPLMAWGVLTVLFAYLYAALAVDGATWNWLDAAYLSVRHGLVIGGLVRTGHMQTVIDNMFCCNSSGLALLMIGQTLLSAVFLFFLFLALRNHIRIR